MSIINSLQKLTLLNTKQCASATIQIRNASNRSRRGLYDNRDIRSGNNVPFSLKKTKRTFKPNVFKKRLFSEILDEMIQFHATTGALRSIDKAGGLDNYLLHSGNIKEGEGWKVRERILQKVQDRERKGLGLFDEVLLKNEHGAVKEVSVRVE